MVFVLHRKHTYGPKRPLTEIVLFLYVHDIRTSQETCLWTSTACYGVNITLYIYYAHTSQERHFWTSKVSYGFSFTFLHVDDVRTSEKAHL
jgi:hypothetical protein